MLGYYRNPINHIFMNEGLIVVSIQSFGNDKAWTNGVSVDELYERTIFIAKLLKREE